MKKLSAYRFFQRALSLGLSASLIFAPNSGYAQSVFVASLPEPGTQVAASAPFIPVLFKGLVIHPDKPLSLDFIVDSGNDNPAAPFIKEESLRMAQYFLAALTVREDQLWVNLSPFEKDRIIEDDLGRTVLGRDMLAQDYVLKQLSASLIYPEKNLGKEFWSKIYTEARVKFATTDVPLDTFNKVWIMPAQAEVFVKGNAVYITKAHLKVMLDADHLAVVQSVGRGSIDRAPCNGAGCFKDTDLSELTRNILREVIVPAIEREVNEGVNFAPIRQIYHAAILAKWYRARIRASRLAQAYVDRNLVSGVTSNEKTIKEDVYQRYMAAFRKGVFNYIRDEKGADGEIVPRKYFSGGEQLGNISLKQVDDAAAVSPIGQTFLVQLALSAPEDAAMNSPEERDAVRRSAAINSKIASLVEKLNNHGIKTRVHHLDLLALSKEPDQMVARIQHFTALKRPEDIYRILLWRLHAGQKDSRRPVLGGMDYNTAVQLYNAFFDQEDQLKALATAERPINVVFFHQGGERSLTRILQTKPNVNIKIIVSGTGDGLSWFHGARIFKATGITAAGRSLVDLATDEDVVKFCDYRIDGSGRFVSRLTNDFKDLVRSLLESDNMEEDRIELTGEMRGLHNIAMQMDVDKRLAIAASLEVFLQHWDQLKTGTDEARKFSLHNVPIRTILLLGMSRENNWNWQLAVNKMGKLLGVRTGHQVIFPVKERGFLVGLAKDGTLLVSQTALNYYSQRKEMLGLWLIDPQEHKKLREKTEISGIPVSQLFDLSLPDDNMREEILETTRRVAPDAVTQLADHLSLVAINEHLEPEVSEVLAKADILFYSGNVETDVGGALVIPGFGEAIAAAPNALKVLVSEIDSPQAAGSLQTALDKLNLYARGQGPGNSTAGTMVDYVLAGMQGDIPLEDLQEQLQMLETNSAYQIRAVSVQSPGNSTTGYAYTSLIDTVIALLGVKRVGFALSSINGLIPYRDMNAKENEMGLFHGKKSVADLIDDIQSNWSQILAHGAFVFDVDKTILPKGSGGLGEYKELANLFMRLLREGVRVAIISGNSRQEQMKRIYQAIQDQMKDRKKALKRLTLYVDGGATKVGFNENGEAVLDDEYNRKHAMPLLKLAAALGGGLSAANLRQWLEDGSGGYQSYFDAVNEYVDKNYPGLKFVFPWVNDDVWQPEVVTPEDIQARIKSGEFLAVPWIETRGEKRILKEGGAASVTVKPTPPVRRGNGMVDIRPELKKAVEALLLTGRVEINDQDGFNIRGAGTSSLDITSMLADKPWALMDFIGSLGLWQKYIYYFGDEFFLIKGQAGNDLGIATKPELDGVHPLGVNADFPEGAPERVIWIGRGPQAVFEFLQKVLDAAMVRESSAIKGGIDIKDINLVANTDSAGVSFDSQSLRDILTPDFHGFRPEVVGITSVQDPLQVLNVP